MRPTACNGVGGRMTETKVANGDNCKCICTPTRYFVLSCDMEGDYYRGRG